MFKNVILSLSFIFIGVHPLFSMDHSKSKDNDLIETGVKVAFVSAVIASCTYAFYKLATWLFTKSNEQLLSEAKNCYSNAKKLYNPLITVWLEEHHTRNEDFLSKLPFENESAICALGNYIEDLKKHAFALKGRLKEFAHSKKHTALMQASMEKQLKSLQGFIKELKPIYAYAAQHKHFFTLQSKIRILKKCYHRELSSVEQHRKDEQIMYKVLTSFIMSTAKENKYPFIQFINHLSDAIKSLNSLLNDNAYEYPILERSAHQLLEILESIHSLIIIHPSYHAELQEQERMRLEQEKIALERAKVRAQEEQARALNEQNWLLSQEIRNQKRILEKMDQKDTCNIQ